MVKKLLLYSLLSLGVLDLYAAYVPLTIAAGYNADVIANGIGTGLATTTNDVDAANYCFFGNGWQLNATSTPATTGLPATGLINSAVTPGLTYQLAGFSVNNDLRLATNTSGTLTFQTPSAAQTLYVLAVTGSGSSTMTVQINFTDLTSQTATGIAVADWYGGTSVAVTGFQRMNRTTNALDNGFNGPNMYQYSIPITAANQAKLISSILITRTAAVGVDATLNVFAVSIDQSTIVSCPAPSTLTATPTATSASLNWTNTGTPLGYQIKYGPAGFNVATAGTPIYTTSKPYNLNPPLAPATAYDYYVRSVCTVGDTSLWSAVKNFSTLCAAPSITSATPAERCGTGTVNLQAAASSGTLNWYAAATGGSPLASGSTFTTPSLTATTNYYVAASSGAGNFATYNTGLPNAIQSNNFSTTSVGWGLRFTVTQSCFIDSVGIYPVGTGTVSVRIWDAATQAVVYTGPVSQTVTGTGTTKEMISVASTSIPPGNYIMGLASVTGLTNLRNEGFNAVAYPFTCPALSVTTGSQGFASPTNNVYYFCYDWRVRVGTACESPRQLVTATIKTLPIVNLGNDTTICPNITHPLNAGNTGSTYVWSTGATTQTINATTANTYSVQVTAPNGCISTDSKVITNGVNPVNVLAATTNLCDGETASLNAGNTGSTYLWSPNSQVTQTINETDGGNYSVVITSADGCKITSTTNLIIRPLPVDNLGNDTSICDGDAIPLDAGNPGYAYQWSNGATSQVINASDSGLYSVLVTTPYNCTNEEDIHISYLPSPKVEGFNFVPEFYDNLGQVKFSPLMPTNVNSYLWNFGDGSPTTTAVNPVHIYTTAGTFIVTLKVFNGCGNFEISLPINVDLTTGLVTLSQANADVNLYPNPSREFITIDNKTDDVKMERVVVFNILGALVYEQKVDNQKQHTFNVSKLASGVYSVRILTDKGIVVKRFEVLR